MCVVSWASNQREEVRLMTFWCSTWCAWINLKKNERREEKKKRSRVQSERGSGRNCWPSLRVRSKIINLFWRQQNGRRQPPSSPSWLTWTIKRSWKGHQWLKRRYGSFNLTLQWHVNLEPNKLPVGSKVINRLELSWLTLFPLNRNSIRFTN